jgi:hypothetical protein
MAGMSSDIARKETDLVQWRHNEVWRDNQCISRIGDREDQVEE